MTGHAGSLGPDEADLGLAFVLVFVADTTTCVAYAPQFGTAALNEVFSHPLCAPLFGQISVGA